MARNPVSAHVCYFLQIFNKSQMVMTHFIKFPNSYGTSGPDTHGQSEKQTGMTNTIAVF
jgi:hypothetical protein